jgi:aminomethyltransferase
VPVYRRGKQIGQATSLTFSPVLKQFVALATLRSPYTKPGQPVSLELTVEYVRHRVPAVITKLPFFNPERKRSQYESAQTSE